MKSIISFLVSGAVLLGSAVRPAQAANLWWDGTLTGGTGNGASDGGTATWDTTTQNWDQGNGSSRVAWVNGNNDTAIFGGTAGTVSLGTGITVGGLQFDTANYLVQNNTLTFGTSGSIVANTNATISSVIAGSVGITKTGAGTLTLTGANTYSGGTSINNGTLQIGNGSTTGALGSGNIVNNGKLVYNYPSSGNVSLPSGAGISGNGNLSATAGVIQFNGNITLGGSQTYAQNSGTGLYKGLYVATSSTLTGSAISMTGDMGKDGSSGNSLTLDTSAANGPITLDISIGRGSIWYSLASFSANAGTGSLTVPGGYAAYGWSAPIALRGALNISASLVPGALSFTGTAASVISGDLTLGASTANTLTVDPGVTMAISGNLLGGSGASITKLGTGMLTLSGANTYTGGMTVAQGQMVVPSCGSLASGSTITVSNTATLSVAAGATARTLSNNMVLKGGTVLGGIQDNGGTGGRIVVTGDGVTHIFTNSGTLTIPTSVTANELLVGGGGGGYGYASGWYCSGGGGGQVTNLTSQSLPAGATTVTVGSGGTAVAPPTGNGGASSISSSLGTISAVGGYSSGIAGQGGTSGSGKSGGTGGKPWCGGGGGDSAVGGAPVTGGGAGGAGSANTAIAGLAGYGYGQLSGGSCYFGGGGAGQPSVAGPGGLGGGGAQSVAGSANTGGGGGGNASGGSGIVVVQYPYSPYALAGTLTLGGTVDVQSASTLDAYMSGGLLDITGVMQTTTGTGGVTIVSSTSAGGVVRYSNSMLYKGGTTVAAGGTLVVNGSVTGAVTVAAGGTLGGTGVVAGVVTNSGTITAADTNGVGTLTVTNLVMKDYSTYVFNYNDTTNDVIVVSGTLSLPSVATVDVVRASGTLPVANPAVLFTAPPGGISGSVSGWTVRGDARPNSQLIIRNNQVQLALPTGLLIMLD